MPVRGKTVTPGEDALTELPALSYAMTLTKRVKTAVASSVGAGTSNATSVTRPTSVHARTSDDEAVAPTHTSYRETPSSASVKLPHEAASTTFPSEKPRREREK